MMGPQKYTSALKFNYVQIQSQLTPIAYQFSDNEQNRKKIYFEKKCKLKKSMFFLKNCCYIIWPFMFMCYK